MFSSSFFSIHYTANSVWLRWKCTKLTLMHVGSPVADRPNERWHHYNFHWWQETTPNLSDSYHLPFFSLAHAISHLWRKRRRHPWTMSLKQEGESGTRRSSTEHCKLHHVNCVHSRLWEKFLSCWCLTSSTKPVNTHLFAKKCLHLATHCERERDQLKCTMQTERKRGGTKLT